MRMLCHGGRRDLPSALGSPAHRLAGVAMLLLAAALGPIAHRAWPLLLLGVFGAWEASGAPMIGVLLRRRDSARNAATERAASGGGEG